MNLSRTLLLALTAGLLLAAEAPFHLAVAQPPSGAAGEDQADLLFREGNADYDRGDFPAAVDKYAAAFALKKTHDIAANLGATELKLRKHAEAARHLAYALKNFPPSGDEKKRAGLKARYEEARAQVVAVSVATEAGAEVSIGGVSVGTAPLAEEAFVAAGQDHVVEARLGDRVGTNKVRGGAGESAKVEIAIPAGSAAAPPPGVPPTQPPVEEGAGGGPPLWPGFVIGGVGVAGLGVGLGLFLAGEGASGDAEDLAAGINESGTTCDPPRGPRAADCSAVGEETSAASSLHLGGGLAMGVGAAMAVGGAVYLIWASSADEEADAAKWQPWVSAESFGSSVRGSF